MSHPQEAKCEQRDPGHPPPRPAVALGCIAQHRLPTGGPQTRRNIRGKGPFGRGTVLLSQGLIREVACKGEQRCENTGSQGPATAPGRGAAIRCLASPRPVWPLGTASVWMPSPRRPPGYPRRPGARLGVPGAFPRFLHPRVKPGGPPGPTPERLEPAPRPVVTNLCPRALLQGGEVCRCVPRSRPRGPGSLGWGRGPGGSSRVRAEPMNKTRVRILPLVPACALVISLLLLLLSVTRSLFRERPALFFGGGCFRGTIWPTGPRKTDTEKLHLAASLARFPPN